MVFFAQLDEFSNPLDIPPDRFDRDPYLNRVGDFGLGNHAFLLE
jgi:hypothetical protein